MKKLLYIDPWCADKSNLFYYSTGLANSLAKYYDLTMISQYNCTLPPDSNYHVYKLFFKKSFGLKDGAFRTIVRGLEYVITYLKIFKLAKNKKYDVIHIEWPLLYKFDHIALKILKKHCRTLSLKAHNVLPHSSGNKYVKDFRKIYSSPDIILVHGSNLVNEMNKLFPEYKEKVCIQRHGLYLNHDTSVDDNLIDKSLKSSIQSANKVYLFCGRIHYDKGGDRLAKIWAENFGESTSILVFAGKPNSAEDSDSIHKYIDKMENVIFIEDFVDNNLMNYLLSNADLIILPYRDGSMSGIAFSAVEFSKPLLCTKFGVIDEYIVGENMSYLVDNDDNSLKDKLIEIDNNYSKEQLAIVGTNLRNHFINEFSWDSIAKKLYIDVFSSNRK